MNIPGNIKNRAGFDDVLKTFLEIEDSRRLLLERENGIPWWELVRYDLYKKILSEKGVQHAENKKVKITVKWIWDCIRLFFISLTWKCPLKAPRDSIVFIGHPRKKREGKGFIDVYTEPFIDFVPSDYSCVVIERPFNTGIRFLPELNKNILYLDALLSFSALLRVLFMSRLSEETRRCCRMLQDEYARYFDVTIDVEKHVKRSVGKWRSETVIFKWLFRILRPKAVIIVVSSGNESMVAAARFLDIPTAELQHGSPAEGKLNYDYPGNRKKHCFPDFFLSFGDVWTRNVSLPLPNENIIPVGFPYMQSKKQSYRGVQKRDQIVILSQPSVTHILSRFAKELVRHVGDGVQVLYKVHPQEAGSHEAHFRELADSGIKLMESDSDLYRLLAESRWQVGVYSTAIYEGLAFSCRTFIVNCSGAEYMKPLIDAGFATLVDSPMEIKLDDACEISDSSELFPEVTDVVIASAIERIVKNEENAPAI